MNIKKTWITALFFNLVAVSLIVLHYLGKFFLSLPPTSHLGGKSPTISIFKWFTQFLFFIIDPRRQWNPTPLVIFLLPIPLLILMWIFNFVKYRNYPDRNISTVLVSGIPVIVYFSIGTSCVSITWLLAIASPHITLIHIFVFLIVAFLLVFTRQFEFTARHLFSLLIAFKKTIQVVLLFLVHVGVYVARFCRYVYVLTIPNLQRLFEMANQWILNQLESLNNYLELLQSLQKEKIKKGIESLKDSDDSEEDVNIF